MLKTAAASSMASNKAVIPSLLDNGERFELIVTVGLAGVSWVLEKGGNTDFISSAVIASFLISISISSFYRTVEIVSDATEKCFS